MTETQLPIDFFHWGLALFPLIGLLVLLIPLQWTAPKAAPVGMVTAAIIALLAFRNPLEYSSHCQRSGYLGCDFYPVCDLASSAALSHH